MKRLTAGLRLPVALALLIALSLLVSAGPVVAGAGLSAPPAGSATQITAPPPNPAFLESPAWPPIGWPSSTVDGHGLGVRPTPQDFSYARGMQVPSVSVRAMLPATYDLRALGRVTSVKDQGLYGTCWAFAACGSLESCLLPGETRDFSEDNMVLVSGFDLPGSLYDAGGQDLMSTAYLVRWGGPVYESDDAYGDGTTPPGLTPRKHVQEVDWIPPRGSALDNDNIKHAVMQYGGVSGGMYMSAGVSYFNDATDAYYYTGAGTVNHGILIVGWDDDYAAANFAGTPPGNGAFIVKNSYGTGWGSGGYFHVSYYDTRFARDDLLAVFRNAESTSNYAGVYQHDPLGLVGTAGFSSSTGWFANVYTAQATASLSAVGFYTVVPGASYEVYTGSSLATKALRTSGTLAYMGYHTVTLPSPVTLASGQQFAVAVKMTTPGYSAPIAVEYPEAGYSGAATAQAGQSYVSPTGTVWSDLTSAWNAEANVCLKAYTTATGEQAPTVTSPNGGESWIVGSAHNITWSTGSGASATVQLSRSGTGGPWETLVSGTSNDGTQPWTVTGPASASARIRITTPDGADVSDASFTISAATDMTPPTVSVSGSDTAWHKHPVTLTFTASDAGSGVYSIAWLAQPAAAFWHQVLGSIAEVTVPAPADHSWDGVNTIWYYGYDNAGNYPDPVTTRCNVKIDTRRPTTKAPRRNSVRRYRYVRLFYRVADAKPCAGKVKVTIKIKTLRGVTKKTLRLGQRYVNKLQSYRFRCTLPRRTYRFYVYATDGAGNKQARVGSNRLVVR